MDCIFFRQSFICFPSLSWVFDGPCMAVSLRLYSLQLPEEHLLGCQLNMDPGALQTCRQLEFVNPRVGLSFSYEN